jgi:hypothetical protein
MLQALLIVFARFDAGQNFAIVIDMLFVNDLFFIQILSFVISIERRSVGRAINCAIASGVRSSTILALSFRIRSIGIGFRRKMEVSALFGLGRLRIQQALAVNGGRRHFVVVGESVAVQGSGTLTKPRKVRMTSLEH